MNTRVIFSDLDGTLLDDRSHLSSFTKSELPETIRNNDLFFSVASGRPPHFVEKIVSQFDLGENARYHVCYNGGVIFDMIENQIVSERVFILEDVRLIIEYFINRNERVIIFTEDKIFTNHSSTALYKTYGERVENLDLDNFSPHKIYKINASEFERSKLPDEFVQRANFAFYGQRGDMISAEISPLGVDKGTGLLKICELLGVTPSQSLAFGDAANDRQMLKYAGLGVAMANAEPLAQLAADEICKLDNHQDGVAKYIKQYFCD
ncbi:MAG: HAD family hydrolase [Candidatus Sacchiramonaceae bacterium]|nr:HAD family hydrolase [Candidatus Saccharimonadaceae bacterium]